MFTEHEILVNQDEVLDALRFCDFMNCILTKEFVLCPNPAKEVSTDASMIAVLVAADLIERYDVLQIRKEGKTHRLYGHDEDGEEHLLLISHQVKRTTVCTLNC